MQLKNFFLIFLPLFANISLAVVLLLANLSPLINPEKDVFFAFLGLAFPYFILLNFVFIVYWAILKHKYILISILLFAISIPNVCRIFAINIFPNSISGKEIKIMSYNVQLFGLYDWRNNINKRNQILDFLAAEKPDIICFQEYFFSHEVGYFDTKDTLTKLLGLTNIHEEYTHFMTGGHQFGIATMSRFPIVNQKILAFENDDNNIAMYSDIKIGNDTIRVYNAHLSSLRLQEDDYDVLKNSNSDFINNINALERILYSLKNAFINRVPQLDKVLYSISKSPYKTVFCADMNDTPISYSYHETRTYLKDAHLKSGFGYGNTYIGKVPSFRIDYIFHDKRIKSKKFKKHSEKLSDHHAISCLLEL